MPNPLQELILTCLKDNPGSLHPVQRVQHQHHDQGSKHVDSSASRDRVNQTSVVISFWNLWAQLFCHWANYKQSDVKALLVSSLWVGEAPLTTWQWPPLTHWSQKSLWRSENYIFSLLFFTPGDLVVEIVHAWEKCWSAHKYESDIYQRVSEGRSQYRLSLVFIHTLLRDH